MIRPQGRNDKPPIPGGFFIGASTMEAFLKARLREPSTWYGLGVVIAGAASHFAPSEWSSFLAGITFVLGGGAIVTPEKRS